MRTFFDNREADIGSFIRRHLAGPNLQELKTLLNLGSNLPAPPTPVEQLTGILNLGRNRFDAVVEERGVDIPKLGYKEAALFIDGNTMDLYSATESFLQRLFATRPMHSGWPPWIDLVVRGRKKIDPTLLTAAGRPSWIVSGARPSSGHPSISGE